MPAAPITWMVAIARNRALDLIRRDVALRGKLDILERATPEADVREQALGDDELAMMFMCCHPSLPHAGRIALTLKTVGGFGGKADQLNAYQYQAGRPSGANTKMATIITIRRKLVPQRTCRRE